MQQALNIAAAAHTLLNTSPALPAVNSNSAQSTNHINTTITSSPGTGFLYLN